KRFPASSASLLLQAPAGRHVLAGRFGQVFQGVLVRLKGFGRLKGADRSSFLSEPERGDRQGPTAAFPGEYLPVARPMFRKHSVLHGSFLSNRLSMPSLSSASRFDSRA